MRPASRTLGALIDEMATVRPHAEAVVFRALLAVGVRRGDRVAVLLPNRPEWLIAALAIARIGGVVTAISTYSTPRELVWALDHSEAAALVTVDAFRGRGYFDALQDLCPELGRNAPGELRSDTLPRLRTVVCFDERRHDGVFHPDERLRRAAGELRAGGGAGAPRS